MNLYLRLLRILVRQLWSKPLAQPMGKITLGFRAWFHDCDFNLHLTSSRYFAFMDLCRIDLLTRLGISRNIVKYKWKFVVNAQEITYIKEIPPLAKFEISSKILAWDEKYFYVEHRVERKGKLYCLAHIRIAALQQGKVISMKDVFTTCGFTIDEPQTGEIVPLWKSLLNQKKVANR